ncbi:uncharacterized protein LOC113204612 [Frankliniella occidentalis]|uniref:Uncharacterized protein LOC113204612 n=1 Tax=Frankliniella occidentalis TaxID=133901 RepID=A0A6J1S8U6_FRAOC|nr:uncharacterized protein LOC113204612 [Frankliniella occidentalis]
MAGNSMAMDVETSSSPSNDMVMRFSRIMNTRSQHLASHHFSENVVLDWFGRTIAGKENVLKFLFQEVHLSNHDIIEVKKTEDNTQKRFALQRAINRYRQPSCETDDDFDVHNDSGIFEGCDTSFSSSGSLTPISKITSDLSRSYVSRSMEDTLDFYSPIMRTPITTRAPKAPNAVKRQTASMVLKSLKQLEFPKNLNFVDAAGVISFCPEDDIYTSGRNYSKHCHLQLGYFNQTSVQSTTFAFILYNNEMPCRRNLSRIFDACDCN